jgi:hypothetical protein
LSINKNNNRGGGRAASNEAIGKLFFEYFAFICELFLNRFQQDYVFVKMILQLIRPGK